MAKYSGTRAGAIFSGAGDLIHLFASSGEVGRILEVGWGGEATTSTAMRTRVARATTPGTSPTTAVDLQQLDQAAASSRILDCVTTVTSPTYASGSLIPFQSWNAHGGVVRWLAAPGEEILVLGAAAAAHVTLRNEVGTANGSAGVVWEE